MLRIYLDFYFMLQIHLDFYFICSLYTLINGFVLIGRRTAMHAVDFSNVPERQFLPVLR